MKTKSNRRGRRQRGYRGLLWVLAAGLLLFGLIAQQNILLGTSSRHALLMDARTGQVLARKRSGEEAAPASLTKMMTVLLATEALPDLDTPVTLPEDIFPALYKADASMAGFQPGETVTVRDLLYGAMLPSGAECCEALARQVSGSEEAFVALMNRKAGELSMKHTHFANCTGLTSPEHYSSAADLAVLLQAALNNETFRTVFTTGQYTSSVTAQHPKGLYMASTLLSRLDGGEVTGGQILGGKTGYTDAAGLCLASLAVVNEKEYILVTLGGTRKPRDGADQHHGCCAGVPQTGKEKMTVLRQFYRQSVARECPVRYNGSTNRTAGSQGGQNDVRTEQDRFWEFSGTAAQGEGHDPEGACRLPVCFG